MHISGPCEPIVGLLFIRSWNDKYVVKIWIIYTFLDLVSQSSASPRLELIILLSTVKGNSSPNLSPCPAWWSKKQIKDVSLNQVGGPGDNWGKASWKFTSALSASITDDDDDDRLLLERNIHMTCINSPDLFVGVAHKWMNSHSHEILQFQGLCMTSAWGSPGKFP